MREVPATVTGETKATSKNNAFSSIRAMLVALLLLVLVPILLSQAFFSYDRCQSKKRAESEANLHLARATAQSFDTFLQDILHQEMTIGLAFTSSQALSEEEKSRILLAIQAGNPALWHLFWHNPTGRVTAATGSQFVGMDLSDREYYRAIVAGKEWVVSDLLLSRTTQQPSFTISRGIRNTQGELLGIIVAGILPAKLDRVLAVERSGDVGVSLLDSKGIHAYRYPATQYSWEQRSWLKLYPVIAEVLKGKEVVANLVADRTGINRIVAFTPVPSIGWVAACSRSEEEVVGPIIAATLQETGLIVLIALVSLCTAVALSRTISTSVITLRNHALSLGQGEPQNPLTLSRPAEIKDLAEAFNKMAEEIRFREKALRESEDRLRLALEAADLGTWDLDLVTARVKHSPRYDQILGYEEPQPEWTLAICLRHILSEDRQIVIAAHPPADGTDRMSLEARVRRPDGSIRWINSRGRVHFDSEGRAVRMIGVVADITERKRAEEELRASNRELEEFNRAMVGRELRMIELKREVNQACVQLGRPPRYPFDDEEGQP